jgi:hypothetical protein
VPRFDRHLKSLSRLAELHDDDEEDGFLSTKAVLDAHDIVFDAINEAGLTLTTKWIRKLQEIDQHPRRRLRIAMYTQLVEQIDSETKGKDDTENDTENDTEKPELARKINSWLKKLS